MGEYNDGILLLLISFIAGILTILAPCVLPVLPIIIGGSINGDFKQKARPYIIGVSLAGSIILFTILLKRLTLFIDVPANALNWFSGTLLVALGLVSVFPQLWERLVVHFNWEARSMQFLGKTQKSRRPYLGAVLVGLALGPVFASCSPTYAFILASVLPTKFAIGLIYLSAYVIGLAAALLVISLVGKRLIKKLAWAVDTHSLFRRILGGLFILIGVAVFTGYLVTAQTWLSAHLPFDETKLERVLLSGQTPKPIAKAKATTPTDVLNVAATPAPEFAGLTNWINSSPLTLAQLKGKVVLVDFWTYSCINCIRSIPYIEKYYRTYASQGLVVVGVNTPEFAFEHKASNVQAAVKSDGITYPVALDNNYDTWNAFNNSSWPADYLIDKQGNIRYISLGEGGYDTTERAIQELLGVHQTLQTKNYTVPASASQTPETYFGTNRESGFTGSPDISNAIGSTNFTASSNLKQNQWTLNGGWDVEGESITSTSATSTLTFNTFAKDTYVVAAPTNGAAQVSVAVSPSTSVLGPDVSSGLMTIDSSRLYHIVSNKTMQSTTVSLTVPKGVSLYTFTFGS